MEDSSQFCAHISVCTVLEDSASVETDTAHTSHANQDNSQYLTSLYFYHVIIFHFHNSPSSIFLPHIRRQ